MSPGQLNEAAIHTNDLEAAERFYHDVLGLELISRMEDRGLAFRCGATVLLVFDPARTRIPDAGVPAHGASGEGHIAFVIDDSEIGAWRKRLEEYGITIELEVNWPTGGRSLYSAIRPEMSWSSRHRRCGSMTRCGGVRCLSAAS